ncbi:glycosyltransferase family 2 protein [Candidatus Bathyarchaeota archaeon]|nr:MAG: glycosyltransferase family 2 protein [Candidatus Bathyarchaeota archaeon]
MDLIHIILLFFLVLVYGWISYNLPIFAVGVKCMRRKDYESCDEPEKHEKGKNNVPFVSIIVPAKNEERVIGRLLRALLNVEYPKDRMEIIVVEDGSDDNTPEICKRFSDKYPHLIRFFHRSTSNGKPSALNYGLRYARGDIIAVFDADNVPQPDVLRKVMKYFDDPEVAAVQGTTCALNADKNMLTKLIAYEEALWLKNYIRGKDILNLFVPLTGSCQFIRREIAEKVRGWDERFLSEDVEMSARLTKLGYKVKYAPDIISWQEVPSSIVQLVKQRIRWNRGFMEVAIKYGRLLKSFKKKTIDAEITLMGPYIQSLFLINYLIWAYISLFKINLDPIIINMTTVTPLLTTITLLIAGIALTYITKPRSIKNILWLPFIQLYWFLECGLTFYALLQILFKRPSKWIKTVKTGECTEESVKAILNLTP